MSQTAPVPQIPAEPDVRTRLAYAGVLAVLVAFGYGSVATSFFLADDFNILDVITQAENLWEGTAIPSGWMYFRPLTALSFWFNWLAFGYESATSYHVFALVCHWVNAYLVARLAWRFFPQAIGVGVAGAAFAVMPIHPECITWISARADVLCAIGTLWMATGWIDFLRGQRGRMALVECFGGFLFALGTKDSAIILPAVCLALLVMPRARSIGAVGLAFGAVLAVLGVYLAVRFSLFGGSFFGAQAEGQNIHTGIDLENAMRFTLDAMRLMLIPGPTDLRNGLCMMLVLYMLLRHPSRRAFYRIAWPLGLLFLIELAPAANGERLDGNLLTSTRFLYMPSMFFCIALGVLVGTGPAVAGPVTNVVGHRRAMMLTVAASALILVYTAGVRRNNKTWAEAGAISATIVDQLRQAAVGKDYKWLFIHGLPDSHGGAYVFRNGIDTATKLFVSESLVFPSHGAIDKKIWEEGLAKRRADPGAYPEILMVRWDADRRELITP